MLLTKIELGSTRIDELGPSQTFFGP